jgi:spore germination cell wall hydrolase CwlJ-like protein
MSFLERAAGLVVATLALAGLAGLSTPGQAAGLQAVQAAAFQTTPATLLVPAPLPDTQVAVPALAETQPAVATAEPGFDSLDDAIAAQAKVEADEATRCLAAAIYFEAKGEPVDGQLAVAEVIINRAKSGRFPDDVCGVVKQRGQFSFVHSGAIPEIDGGRTSYRTAVAVAKVAMAKAWQSSAPKALYFHARREPMAGRVVKIAAIGNHVFYR